MSIHYPNSREQQSYPGQQYAQGMRADTRAIKNYPLPNQGMPPQRQKVAPPMPKAQANAIISAAKKWILAGSVVVFAILGGVAIESIQQQGLSTTNPNTANQNGTVQPNQSQQQSPSFNPNTNQQPQGGGFGFGSNATQQPPVSGSSVS
jgi:hypothetical protein